MVTPLFSILHPTIRLPDGWRAAHDAWRDNCDDWPAVDYVLTVDLADHDRWPDANDISGFVINSDRHCPVDAFNAAARACDGQILIVAADDWFPCPHWDTMLRQVIPDPSIERVVWIESEHTHILTHPVLTRAYYERPDRGGCGGNLYHADYQSFGADNDFTAVAQRDGVIVRPDICFEHRHWLNGRAERDAAYDHTNLLSGDKDTIFARRQSRGFAS